MSEIVTLFPDTNFFLQCLPPDQLDWSAWQTFDEVHLILSWPIQVEIDSHKQKGNDRLARRARTAATLFRDIIIGRKAYHEVRTADPAVKLFMKLQLKPDPDLSEILDYTRADGQLPGVAYNFAKQSTGSDVRVLTDDTGVMAGTDAVGMMIAEFTEKWRLPPEISDADKKLKALEKRIAELEETEPRFEIECLDHEGKQSDRLEFIVHRHEALTPEEVADLIATLRARCPLETDFGPRERQEKDASEFPGFKFGSKKVFTPATESEIQAYKRAHTAWLAECERILENLHADLETRAAPLAFKFSATNIGSRPATDVLLTLTVQGNLRITPPTEEVEDKKAEVEERAAPELPAVPQAPKGSWQTVNHLAPFRGMMDLTEQLGVAQGHPVWPDDLVRPYIASDFNRDPNEFYYKPKRPSGPVSSFGFECAQWRHGAEQEAFSGEIHLEDQVSEAAGIITCVISASNLSKSISGMVRVSIKTEAASVWDDAAYMVEALTA